MSHSLFKEIFSKGRVIPRWNSSNFPQKRKLNSDYDRLNFSGNFKIRLDYLIRILGEISANFSPVKVLIFRNTFKIDD